METTSQIEENIKKLNNLNKSGQLGGKGTIRRKKLKRTGKIKYTHPKCKDEILLEAIARRINKEIVNINNLDSLELFQIWFDDNIYFYLYDFTKYELEDTLLLEELIDEPVEYFYNYFCDSYSNPIQLITNIEIYRQYLSLSGIESILELLKETETILHNKKYLDEKKDDNEEELTTTQCFKLMDLNITDEITESQIKKAYRKKALEIHPDKHPGKEEQYQQSFNLLHKAYKKLLGDHSYQKIN